MNFFVLIVIFIIFYVIVVFFTRGYLLQDKTRIIENLLIDKFNTKSILEGVWKIKIGKSEIYLEIDKES